VTAVADVIDLAVERKRRDGSVGEMLWAWGTARVSWDNVMVITPDGAYVFGRDGWRSLETPPR
jgi:hypothetical protein